MMIKTTRPDGKDGVCMNAEMYDVLSMFIIKLLREEFTLTLPELIVMANENLPYYLQHEIGFNLMQVKMDLIARGAIIQSSPADFKGKLPVLSLNRNYKAVMARENPIVGAQTIL